jgi:hypothetical protein
MGERQAIHNRNVRFLILLILHESRLKGRAESGGWLTLSMLRKLLTAQGYPLTENELKEFCLYLWDPEIGCLDLKKTGDFAPYVYKYRITAKGVRAVEGEEKIVGVGIYSQKDDDS